MCWPRWSSLLFELLADLGKDLSAKQLDALEEGGMRYAPDVHLQDLPRVAEKPVQVKDAVGALVRSAGEYHSTRLEVSPSARRRTHWSTDLCRTSLKHADLVLKVGL